MTSEAKNPYAIMSEISLARHDAGAHRDSTLNSIRQGRLKQFAATVGL
jgi:hypothetical protein